MESQQRPRHFGLLQFHIAQQETAPYPAIKQPIEQGTNLTPVVQVPMTPPVVQAMKPMVVPELITPLPEAAVVATTVEPGEAAAEQENVVAGEGKKRTTLRVVAIILLLILGGSLYLIWHAAPSSTSVAVTPQYFSSPSPMTDGTTTEQSTGGSIEVYITGAVQHPGVYTLDADARVYQLVQAAGGAQADANLVLLNLAAKLSDGQEVYVPALGETPPVATAETTGATTGVSNQNQGQLVNINTASATELRQQLHVSSKTAQAIVTYRQHHGNFASTDALLQVVSKTIYNKIKNMVTV